MLKRKIDFKKIESCENIKNFPKINFKQKIKKRSRKFFFHAKSLIT